MFGLLILAPGEQSAKGAAVTRLKNETDAHSAKDSRKTYVLPNHAAHAYPVHTGVKTPISRADRLLLRQDVPSAITLEHVHRTAFFTRQPASKQQLQSPVFRKRFRENSSSCNQSMTGNYILVKRPVLSAHPIHTCQILSTNCTAERPGRRHTQPGHPGHDEKQKAPRSV